MEWWGAGVVICLERGANDLHMVQLMPLPPHHLLLQQNPEWYRPTQVVLEKAVKRLYVCVCTYLLTYLFSNIYVKFLHHSVYQTLFDSLDFWRSYLKNKTWTFLRHGIEAQLTGSRVANLPTHDGWYSVVHTPPWQALRPFTVQMKPSSHVTFCCKHRHNLRKILIKLFWPFMADTLRSWFTMTLTVLKINLVSDRIVYRRPNKQFSWSSYICKDFLLLNMLIRNELMINLWNVNYLVFTSTIFM